MVLLSFEHLEKIRSFPKYGGIKISRVWLKNLGCHALYKFKIEMGVADSIFEPHPPDFGKILIFSRCSNDSKTIF